MEKTVEFKFCNDVDDGLDTVVQTFSGKDKKAVDRKVREYIEYSEDFGYTLVTHKEV